MSGAVTLANQLIALCAEHGLNALSIDIHRSADGSHFFGSYAHKDGNCGSASVMRDSISGSIGEAITEVLAKCGKSLVEVPELEAAA